MSDFPDMLPSSNRAARDRIEAALTDMDWSEQSVLQISHEHARRVLAGAVRKAFSPELARMRETEATLARLRRVIRSAPEAGTIPTRKLLDALYGEEGR
ncbi:hypothetical protein OG455_41655 [Kitasatospora sp. NBC_01287]|uniref:hypothetical protein n=1 Tax=Kitasatospora sp. NBC_01287 TaxID=2903573 RepID=UPI002256994D|nr:hypothetical protein [Kitasatospora sp. NBC_01287]MCX4751758.1 hypothetical protein [Kitasatospora sp. NBC_01287]MCX4751950.1 hypothetical protein [Kitasatospora sp. NBC_01287]